jgi:hypothetical protein
VRSQAATCLHAGVRLGRKQHFVEVVALPSSANEAMA